MAFAGTRTALAIAALPLAACAVDARGLEAPAAQRPVVALAESSAGHIDVRRIDAHPLLTLVTREGDPSPAIALVVVTDAGPAITTALAALMESRLRAVGFEADVRVDRDAFRARWRVPDAARAPALFAAIAASMSKAVAPKSAEIALAVQRLDALRRNPLDAPELSAAAACTGTLGVAPGEALPDLANDAGARDLEAARISAFRAENLALAAVGPTAFGRAVATALERSSGWMRGAAAPAPAWPSADTAGEYTAVGLDRKSARVTIAARIAEPLAAAAAAERLGAPDSPLVARLRLLPEAWRVTQVAGVARSRGGCIGVVLESAPHAAASPIEPGAALAVAVVRREIAAELALGATAAVAGRQILAAADPREAASRAAWWSLAGAAPGAPSRWIAELGLPPPSDRALRDGAAASLDAGASARFGVEIERAMASVASAGAERRAAVEKGQGELWLLLASPCGVAEEGTLDAGFGALATLAALEGRPRDGVAIEPWIGADGIGAIAHAAARDEREAPADLARRIADAAARTLTATIPTGDAIAEARALLLEHLDRTAGSQGVAFAALAGALAPDHPSWVEPFGLWSKVAGAGAEGLRLRARALAQGPLRVAVLANVDAAQGTAAADAVDRWLAPIASARTCRASTALPSRPGHYEAHLPESALLAQALVAVPVPPPGAQGRDLAELTAAAFDMPGGPLASVFADATASARIVGGERSPALVIDVRAPEGDIGQALANVKALLVRSPTTVTDADLTLAASMVERREQEARADPRRRLADLWSSRGVAQAARPSLTAWRAFLGATLREAAMVVVEARPQ